MIDRRAFLRRAVQSTIAGTAVLKAPRWLLRTAEAATTDHTLLCIFLRGGCDGLNVVVPHGDDEYHRQRPTIRIPSPGAGAMDAVLNLNGYFGFHPALTGLRSTYGQGRLAILPSVHYADAPRSHFESEAHLEQAGGLAGTGWLNRYLAATGGSQGLRGLALAPIAPDSLKGAVQVRALDSLSESVLSKNPGEEDRLVAALQSNYAPRAPGSESEALAHVREAGALALEDLNFLRSLGANAYVPAPAAAYPNTLFGLRLRDAAMLVKQGLGLEVGTIDFGGWDTHVGQGNGSPSGRQSRLLAELDAGLTAFLADLGQQASSVSVLVMTEFGRTLAQNANGGTDHGNASAWFVLGGNVRGGIYQGPGGWPGLQPDQLREERDLAYSLEFRQVMANLLMSKLGLPAALVPSVLPGAVTDSIGFA